MNTPTPTPTPTRDICCAAVLSAKNDGLKFVAFHAVVHINQQDSEDFKKLPQVEETGDGIVIYRCFFPNVPRAMTVIDAQLIEGKGGLPDESVTYGDMVLRPGNEHAEESFTGPIDMSTKAGFPESHATFTGVYFAVGDGEITDMDRVQIIAP